MFPLTLAIGGTKNWYIHIIISFKVFTELIYWGTILWNFENNLLEKVLIFSSTSSMTLQFYSMSADWSMPCLLHHVLMQKSIPLIMEDLFFSNEMLVFSLYLGSLVNNFLNLLFLTVCKSPVSEQWWSLPKKKEPAQLHVNFFFFKNGFNI